MMQDENTSQSGGKTTLGQRTYTPKFALVPLGVAAVVADIIENAIPTDMRKDPALLERAESQLALFLNHLLVNSKYGNKKRNGTTLIAEDARQWYPLIFGRTTITVEGVRYYVGEVSEEENPGKLPVVGRLVDTLKSMGVLDFRGYQKRVHGSKYALSPTLLNEFGILCYGNLSRDSYTTIDRYMKLDSNVGPIEGLLNELPKTAQALFTQWEETKLGGNRAANHNFNSDPHIGQVYNAPARATLRKIYAQCDPIELNVENLDSALFSMVQEFRRSVAKQCTKEEQEQIIRCSETLTTMIESGSRFKAVMMYLSSEHLSSNVVRVLSSGFTKYLKASSGICAILTSGLAFYKPNRGRVYYYPSYRPKAAGGRSYEAHGGFQTLPREIKQFVTRDCTGVNLDIKSCHLRALIDELVTHEMADKCPILTRSGFNVDSIIAEFLPYLKTSAITTTRGERKVKLQKFTMIKRALGSGLRDVIKILLYANLNNGSSRLGLELEYDTPKQIYKEFRRKLKDADAEECQIFLSRVWNNWCAEIGFFKAVESLIEYHWQRCNVYRGIATVTNAAGFVIKLPVMVNADGTKTLVASGKKKLMSHILMGHETKRIFDFVTGNKGKIKVQAFEHDGIYVTIKEPLDMAAPHNDGFSEKAFGKNTIERGLAKTVKTKQASDRSRP